VSVAVGLESLLFLIVAVGLFAYLMTALLAPERF
jgi:K+-transporting ATPase KdpF subunit